MDFPTTPKVALLLSRLQTLNLELTKNMNQLTKRLTHLEEESFVLQPATENIVDRKKEKEHRKKQWKVEVKDIITTPIEFESLE